MCVVVVINTTSDEANCTLSRPSDIIEKRRQLLEDSFTVDSHTREDLLPWFALPEWFQIDVAISGRDLSKRFPADAVGSHEYSDETGDFIVVEIRNNEVIVRPPNAVDLWLYNWRFYLGASLCCLSPFLLPALVILAAMRRKRPASKLPLQ
jgi:hypothetical protein